MTPESFWSASWCDVLDLLDYWSDHPPLHLMVAGYLGVGAKEKVKPPPKAATADEAKAQLAQFLSLG